MSRTLKLTLWEMLFGLGIFELILALIAVFAAKPLGYSILSLELGIAVGTLVAILLLWNMAATIEDAVESKDADYAQKKVTKNAMLRMGFVVLVVAVFWRISAVNVLGIVFAILGIKMGAYLQPTVHRLLEKGNQEKGGEEV